MKKKSHHEISLKNGHDMWDFQEEVVKQPLLRSVQMCGLRPLAWLKDHGSELLSRRTTPRKLQPQGALCDPAEALLSSYL